MIRKPLNRYERRLSLSYSNLSKSKISPAAGLESVRPHGGYRGVQDHFPLSINAFDKPNEYIENVRNTVQTQYVEAENERCGSPQWISRYNSEMNHTGEQPLIVQHFLSGNKQEQRNGVLPARADTPPRLKSATHRHRGEERVEYYQGNSTHQYLTATEMPGQSQQLFNIKHGRPTRTSLLRTRYRSQSAPGVRAVHEIDHLHKQQQMAAKTADRFKTVDVPQELQPLTDSGETIHQFIVGARYNRNIFRDPRCLAATGMTVSRHVQERTNYENENKHGDDLTASSSDSFSSSEFLPSEPSPLPTKQAWGSNTSLSKSRPVSGRNGAPTPTPLNSSREAFASNQECYNSPEPVTSSKQQQQQLPSKAPVYADSMHPKVPTLIDGRALHNTHSPSGGGGGCEDCIMCRKGVPLKGMPGTFSKKTDPVRRNSINGGRDEGGGIERYAQGAGKSKKIKNTVDHQLVQQYHLRILGVKMDMDQVRPQSPRAKQHYATNTTQSKMNVSSRRQSNNNNANNNRRQQKYVRQEDEVDQMKELDTNSLRSSSKISVRISTPCFEVEDQNASCEPSPRDDEDETQEDGNQDALSCQPSPEPNPEVQGVTEDEVDDAVTKRDIEQASDVDIANKIAAADEVENRDMETTSDLQDQYIDDNGNVDVREETTECVDVDTDNPVFVTESADLHDTTQGVNEDNICDDVDNLDISDKENASLVDLVVNQVDVDDEVNFKQDGDT